MKDWLCCFLSMSPSSYIHEVNGKEEKYNGKIYDFSSSSQYIRVVLLFIWHFASPFFLFIRSFIRSHRLITESAFKSWYWRKFCVVRPQSKNFLIVSWNSKVNVESNIFFNSSQCIFNCYDLSSMNVCVPPFVIFVTMPPTTSNSLPFPPTLHHHRALLFTFPQENK